MPAPQKDAVAIAASVAAYVAADNIASRVRAGNSDGSYAEWEGEADAVLAWLKDHGAGRAPSGGNGAQQGSQGGGQRRQKPQTPPCPQCGSKAYDNRGKKATGEYSAKAPDFACSDRDGCGWVKWPEKKDQAAPEANGEPEYQYSDEPF